jgi:hypothetical protein
MKDKRREGKRKERKRREDKRKEGREEDIQVTAPEYSGAAAQITSQSS